MELIKTKKGSDFLSDLWVVAKDVALYLHLPYTTPVQSIIDMKEAYIPLFFPPTKLTNADNKIQ